MSKKPYSVAKQESTGGWYYDWLTIIDDLEAGRYDKAQRDEIYRASLSWVTCACGNQCAAIPRQSDGFPMDDELASFGSVFHAALHAGRYHGARAYLAAIEARAAQLLRGEA